MATPRIRIGISSCLLGQRVRYDGGHKRDAYLNDVLGPHVEFVPVCPEVEMGLGTPREPMRLEREGETIRMRTIDTRIDHTARLDAWAGRRLDALAEEGLSGYVLKAGSPSCGLERVDVFASDGSGTPEGQGLFASALLARFPGLPVEDERHLADPAVRDEFMRRVLEYGLRALSPVRRVPVRRVAPSGGRADTDDVAVEEPLEIRLHDRPFVVIMRTPGADRELAAGFLLAEGVIRDPGELGAVEHCRHPDETDAHNVVNVFLMGEAARLLEGTLAERRNVAANSSCGLCGRVTIDSLKVRAERLASTAAIDVDVLHGLPDALRERQSVFDRTGGLHGAALFTFGGSFVTSAEDVGRHNAVDKVIGRLLLDERVPLAGHVLVVSGRTSFEIVQKAWLAGIEMICAVSAPSSLAIELADEAGITLLGFARERSFNVYAHPERLRGL